MPIERSTIESIIRTASDWLAFERDPEIRSSLHNVIETLTKMLD